MKKKLFAISLALIMAIAGVSVHSYKNNALAKLATDNIEALTFIDGATFMSNVGHEGSCGAYWYNINTVICRSQKSYIESLEKNWGTNRSWCCESCLSTNYCDYETLSRVYF